MALRDGSWTCSLQLEDGRLLQASTDDMTLTQIDTVERASLIAWGWWDPAHSARVAIALFAVLLIRDGEAEDKALQLAGELPASMLRGAFTWVPPEEPPEPAGGDLPDPA